MKKVILLGIMLLLPVISFAQVNDGNLTTFENMARSLETIVGILIPVVFALGLLVFFWGLVRYIFGAEGDKGDAKKTMLWGVIALFVMASVWGIVKFIGDAFGIDENASVPVPGIDQIPY